MRKRLASNGTCLRHRWYTHRPIRPQRGARVQKPLRADGPAIQNGELDPRRVTVTRRRCTRGIETSVCSGRLPVHRVGSVRLRSAVGPHRVGDGSARVACHPVTGAGANPSQAGSGQCRRETTRDRVPEERLIGRGRPWRPSSAGSSPHRAGVHKINASGSVHVFLFARGFGLCSLTR